MNAEVRFGSSRDMSAALADVCSWGNPRHSIVRSKTPRKQSLIYLDGMCGRVIQSSRPLRLAIVEGLDVSDSRMGNVRPRYNAAPSQELPVTRQNHKTGERSLDWGLNPRLGQHPRGGRKPIPRCSIKLKRPQLLLVSCWVPVRQNCGKNSCQQS